MNWNQDTWVLIVNLPVTMYVTIKKYFGAVFPTFSYGYFKHAQNWDNIMNPYV